MFYLHISLVISGLLILLGQFSICHPQGQIIRSIRDPTFFNTSADDGEFFTSTFPDGTPQSYILLIQFYQTLINITIDACVVNPSANLTLGTWTSLNGTVNPSATIATIRQDAASGKAKYGTVQKALTASLVNNALEVVQEMDSVISDYFCVPNPTTDADDSFDPTLPMSNVGRNLLADEVNSPLRAGLKYFGFLVVTSASVGVVVGLTINHVYPNNTDTQTFVSGFIPAAVLLAAGITSWLSNRPLRQDVRTLVAAAALVRLREQASQTRQRVVPAIVGALGSRQAGPVRGGGGVVIEMANMNRPYGGGEYCADPMSLTESLIHIPLANNIVVPEMGLIADAAAEAAIMAAEQGCRAHND